MGKIPNTFPVWEIQKVSCELILTEVGKREMTNSKSCLEAICTEARNTCLTNNWNGMVQMTALSTVLRWPIFRIDFLQLIDDFAEVYIKTFSTLYSIFLR